MSRFSFVGYTSKEVPVGSQSIIDVILQESSQQLDEVVVTALGIRKDSKKLGYSISSISASELTKTASPSLGSALYGKAAGVRIQTAPGGVAVRADGHLPAERQPDPLYLRGADADDCRTE